MDAPIASFPLPDELVEISALTAIDDRTVACVQDEVGVVFFVDVREGRVVRQLPFGRDGDYEGLASVGDALWVLRSDGRLIELAMRGDQLVPQQRSKLGLKNREFEGLGYDPIDRLLLVAQKERSKGSKSERAERVVHRFDPVSGERRKPPALDTTVDRIVADADEAGIELRDSRLKARFSSVAVHPTSGHLYLLSAADEAVLVFTREGRLCAAHLLDAQQMPQPEGMTFLPGGDMVIASEGGEGRGPARIQVFRESRGD